MRKERLPWSFTLGTIGVFIAIVLTLCTFYLRTFDGLHDRNAIDNAQIARNISEGRSFTTRFIRPLNIRHYHGTVNSFPELNHGPIYPYAVAGAFKLRSPSDQAVIWVTIAFALLTAGLTFALGSILFGRNVGLLASATFGLSYPVISTALGGGEWTLAGVFFTALALTVALHHHAASAGRTRTGIVCAAISGALVAALYMTNHVLVGLVVPFALYFAITWSGKKLYSIVFLACCAVFCAPWAVRNAMLTGVPVLGATLWDMLANTTAYPGDTVYRSTSAEILNPSSALLFALRNFAAFAGKLFTGTRDALFSVAGSCSWVAVAFAVTSVLYRFRSSSANAVRGTLYTAIAVFVVAAGLFSLPGSAAVIIAPAICVFGCAYFLLLVEAKKLHHYYSIGLIGAYVLIVAYPTFATIVWPHEPSAPSQAEVLFANQNFGAQIVTKAPLFTDIPWTAAWRTLGLGVWLPMSDDDVAVIASSGLPMSVVVLTPETDKLSDAEAWTLLRNSEVWQAYVSKPDKALKMLLGTLPEGFNKEIKEPEKLLDRFSRRYAISDSIRGFFKVPGVRDPFRHEDVQLFLRKGE